MTDAYFLQPVVDLHGAPQVNTGLKRQGDKLVTGDDTSRRFKHEITNDQLVATSDHPYNGILSYEVRIVR